MEFDSFFISIIIGHVYVVTRGLNSLCSLGMQHLQRMHQYQQLQCIQANFIPMFQPVMSASLVSGAPFTVTTLSTLVVRVRSLDLVMVGALVNTCIACLVGVGSMLGCTSRVATVSQNVMARSMSRASPSWKSVRACQPLHFPYGWPTTIRVHKNTLRNYLEIIIDNTVSLSLAQSLD